MQAKRQIQIEKLLGDIKLQMAKDLEYRQALEKMRDRPNDGLYVTKDFDKISHDFYSRTAKK
jgi:hypothetical protein